MTVTDLHDPEFLEWVAKEYATPEDIARFLPFLKELAEEQRYDWSRYARPEQLPPAGDWLTWLILAGRGFGKTRTGAEWVKSKALEAPVRIAVVAPTFADARDTCMEGESGLLSVLPPSVIKNWNRSMGELALVNGSRIKLFSGDEPERLRGPQHHFAWLDELASFRYPEAWDQLQFGLRLGTNPQTVVTTTPKPTKLIRGLLARKNGVHVTKGSTFDNAANLAPAAVAELRARYEGTRLGRQELHAEVLSDTPGALATIDELDACRVFEEPDPVRTIVSVDPAVTNTAESDETGIAVLSRGEDGHCYMIYDYSCRSDVTDWARKAVKVAMADEVQAGMILYEKNQGADAIGSILRNACQELGANHIVLKDVSASKSKFDRALPLQQWIQQGRFHLVGSFPELEEQLTTFTADSKTSPDRLDSCVHGFVELMLNDEKKRRLTFRG